MDLSNPCRSILYYSIQIIHVDLDMYYVYKSVHNLRVFLQSWGSSKSFKGFEAIIWLYKASQSHTRPHKACEVFSIIEAVYTELLVPCVLMLKLVGSVWVRILFKNSNLFCIAFALAVEGVFLISRWLFSQADITAVWMNGCHDQTVPEYS